MMKRFLSMIVVLMLMLAAIIPAGMAEEVQEYSLDPFEEIYNEFMKSENVTPYTLVARPSRVTGWVDLRFAPSSYSPVMAVLPAKTEMTVLMETPNWLQVRDELTGGVGYVNRKFTAEAAEETVGITATPVVTENGKTNLGVIDINGAFSLQCKIADGYQIQLIKSSGDQVLAKVLPEDPMKPFLQLSVAFDEAYASVERLNDLSDEELAKLEKTFTDNDPMVQFSYSDTGLGTRLMIAHLSEDDLEYVDFLSIYKGYFVECALVPSLELEESKLTEEQIRMCIDFLTEMDFVPAEAAEAAQAVRDSMYITNLMDYNPEDNTVLAIVMHTVTLDEDTVKALKTGDSLEYGTLGDKVEIENIETLEDGTVLINDWITLENYGGEYHIYFYGLEYLEELTRLTLEVPDDLVVLDNIDQATGNPLDEPKTLTVEEFRAMLEAEEYPDFATDNVWVTFDADGQLAEVERVYSPAQ